MSDTYEQVAEITKIIDTIDWLGAKDNLSPAEKLLSIAKRIGKEVEDVDFALYMDQHDPLRHLRNEFHYPKMKDLISTDLSVVNAEEDCVYFSGNSLGLCPRAVKRHVDGQVEQWAKLGVQGHENGELPWAHCDEYVDADMGALVGAREGEIAVMNGLTVNLHLQLISFYRPTAQRHKIMCESKAFPSDHYAFESQIRFHGYDPATSLICVEPRKDGVSAHWQSIHATSHRSGLRRRVIPLSIPQSPRMIPMHQQDSEVNASMYVILLHHLIEQGEYTLHLEDILKKIEEEGDNIALICFSGVQYYTGQLFDIPTITAAGQKKGCTVGWDLAHAAGNVELFLHDWNVDFACWCSYKYINSGAGGLSGFFIHERYKHNDFPKLLGWWGHKKSSRFTMDNELDLSPGAYGYRVSNPPGFLAAPLRGSLEVFKKTSMKELVAKSRLLTSYLELLINRAYKKPKGETANGDADHVYVDILTPSDPKQRGAQLSLRFSIDLHQAFDELAKRGVMCDKRLPHVIRVAPAPLYCSFHDVLRFMQYLAQSLEAAKNC